MYNNYLFDLYGTLVDIHTDEEKAELWEKLSIFYGFYGAQYTAEELKESYLEEVASEKMRQKQKGDKSIAKKQDDSHEAYPEIELEYVFQNLFMRKGIKADLTQSIHAGQMFRILSIDYIKLYDGAKELLQSLKAKGKKVYLLSNAQSIFTRYELKYLGIEALFDDIFISSEYSCKKPDIAFYKQPLEKYGLNAKETIMIGNDYTCDILGAKQVGLNTYYIHSNLSPDLEGIVKSTYFSMRMDLNCVRKRILNE